MAAAATQLHHAQQAMQGRKHAVQTAAARLLNAVVVRVSHRHPVVQVGAASKICFGFNVKNPFKLNGFFLNSNVKRAAAIRKWLFDVL